MMAERLLELVRQICKEHEVEILKCHVLRENVHMFVSVPLLLAISKLVRYLKGKCLYKLFQENRQLSWDFWGRHQWGLCYFVATSCNVTDLLIMEYV